ncbi:MAG: sigma-54-dependent Fis family transcriptional regulator [Deltaproteobacteria bacterium HGW-Deltaproteobacteria-11]|nr:MAG: sigma-54-dependent Fis family transcriptional regulator [Deltaproteobacteria bacterium HGW-Deltaproteobacteria-11]
MAERKSRVLVADDEEEIRKILSHILGKEGFEVITASDGEQAMQKICSDIPDAVLLDVRMPGLNGMEVLKKIKVIDDNLPVVLVTAYADTHQAVEAMKEGAYDYLAKPFDNNEVVWITSRALAEGKLRRNLKSINDRYKGNFSLIESMGPSDKIGRLAADVHRVAKSDFSVIIMGETGSGKELVAKAIHGDSARAEAPFVAVDCGAIPENLLESELFGHEKGSFTGADRQTAGKFESAHGGTLFMDEIGNMPLGSQAKVLRAIQDRKLYRVGGNKPVPVDIRLIVATNQDLQEMAATGTFRKDLYYRLSEFAINIPPLRARKEDIPYLAKRFLDLANIELNKMITGFTDEAVEALMSYNWPGNVRQLRSVIRRATLVSRDEITEKDLSIKRAEVPGLAFSPKVHGTPWKNASLSEIVQQSVLAVEKEVLKEVLRFTGGNKARAARLLQVDYKTMHTKAKKFGIQQNGGSNDDET